MEADEVVQPLTEVLKGRAGLRFNPSLQHPVTPFDNRIIRALSRATKERLNLQTHQPQRQRRGHFAGRVAPRLAVVKADVLWQPPRGESLPQGRLNCTSRNLRPVA